MQHTVTPNRINMTALAPAARSSVLGSPLRLQPLSPALRSMQHRVVFGGRKATVRTVARANATSEQSTPAWWQHLGKGATMLGVAALLVRRSCCVVFAVSTHPPQALGSAAPADAARSGGRVGGSRFGSRYDGIHHNTTSTSTTQLAIHVPFVRRPQPVIQPLPHLCRPRPLWRHGLWLFRHAIRLLLWRRHPELSAAHGRHVFGVPGRVQPASSSEHRYGHRSPRA